MGLACLGSASPADDGWGDDDDVFSADVPEEANASDDWDDWDNA